LNGGKLAEVYLILNDYSGKTTMIRQEEKRLAACAGKIPKSAKRKRKRNRQLVWTTIKVKVKVIRMIR
jgi:hypothetical protein